MILDRIVATKKEEVQELYRNVGSRQLLSFAKAASPARPALDVLRSYRARSEIAVIAEVKKASPSKGVIREDFDPIGIAKLYEQHGAAMLSVLTDQDYFQGSIDYLREIREHVAIPLLRKDFIVDEIQILEARANGADVVLLIAACLDDAELLHCHQVVSELGMAALVEVHTEQELERVLPINPALIGINNRDLKTFQVDRYTTKRIASNVPRDILLVSESGIESHDHVQEVQAYRADAVLVGESLMRATDIGAALLHLRGATL